MGYPGGRADIGDYYAGDYYAGDPFSLKGLVSGLGRGISGFVRGGPVGALSALFPGAQREKALSPELASFGALPSGFVGGSAVGENPGAVGNKLALYAAQEPSQAGLINVGPGKQTGLINIGMGGGKPGPFGFRRMHPNRSTYVTRGGGTSHWPKGLKVHQKGTELVPSRRMNVGNARAIRKALRRVAGFAKLTKRAKRAVSMAASALGVRRHARKAIRRR